LLFNGTLWPMAGGIFVMSVIGFGLMLYMGRIEDRDPV
jgi:DHA1 family bicyclomycin/chloramphenicol resistance-like MFS transporter